MRDWRVRARAVNNATALQTVLARACAAVREADDACWIPFVTRSEQRLLVGDTSQVSWAAAYLEARWIRKESCFLGVVAVIEARVHRRTGKFEPALVSLEGRAFGERLNARAG